MKRKAGFRRAGLQTARGIDGRAAERNAAVMAKKNRSRNPNPASGRYSVRANAGKPDQKK